MDLDIMRGKIWKISPPPEPCASSTCVGHIHDMLSMLGLIHGRLKSHGMDDGRGMATVSLPARV